MNSSFLLVDDDADDAAAFREALEMITSPTIFHTAENGIELFDKLSQHRPDVIFLDINMPKMGGWDSLKKLKSSANYLDIPVVMYSTSSAKRDIDNAYSLGAALFISKPERFADLVKILELIVSGLQDEQLDKLAGFPNVKGKQYRL